MKIEILSNALTVGYFAAMAIPVVLTLAVRRPAALLPRALLLVFGSAAAMALLVVCLWWLLDDALLDYLQGLDRNGDGSWSEAEESGWSAREREYFEFAMNDGARNLFALYVYPVFALTYSAIVVGGILLFRQFRDRDR